MHDRQPTPALPSHLAAACIFTRRSHRSAPIKPPASGVLAELAQLRNLR
ncbi:MAG: hypothetical protein ACKOQM_14180 [Novosphingobium sp.]